MIYAGRGLHVARRVPESVRHHALGDADRGGALSHRVRAGRGLRARERALPRGALLADAAHAARAEAGAHRRGGDRRGCAPASATSACARASSCAASARSAPSRRCAWPSCAWRTRTAASIGFDLAGAEYNYPAKDHKEAFQLILNNNVNCTAHAGEAYGPESIAQAIHYCGAHRIGHGTRLRENGDLLNYVNDHRIPLEICLSRTSRPARHPTRESHPLQFYLRLRAARHDQHRQPAHHRHHRVQGAVLTHQHLRPRARGSEGADRRGFKSAFLPYREKADLLKKVTKELESFVEPALPAKDRRELAVTAAAKPVSLRQLTVDS